jgi:hypothetical protein
MAMSVICPLSPCDPGPLRGRRHVEVSAASVLTNAAVSTMPGDDVRSPSHPSRDGVECRVPVTHRSRR